MPALGDLHDRYPADLARVTVLHCFGIRADGSGNTWALRRALPFMAVVLTPLAVAAGHQLLGHPTSQGRSAYFFWLCYYVVIDLFVVLAQWSGCRAFYWATPRVDSMLTDHGRTVVHSWIDRGTKPWRQVRYMLLGAVLSCLVLWVLSTMAEVTRHMYIDAASYLTVALTGAAGANSLYWVLRASRLSRLITYPQSLRLWWLSPAHTAGVESLSRWYRIVTLWCVAGGTVAFAPWVYLSPYVARNGAYLATKWALVAMMLLAVLLFGFYSQWRLSLAVLEERLSVLHSLSLLLPESLPAHGALTEEEARIVGLYAQVEASPSGVIDGQTIASTLLAIAAGVVPLMVAGLLR